MKFIVVLATTLCVALVNSYPLSEGEHLQSEVSLSKKNSLTEHPFLTRPLLKLFFCNLPCQTCEITLILQARIRACSHRKRRITF